MSGTRIHPELPVTSEHVVVLIPRGVSMPDGAWDAVSNHATRIVVVHHKAGVMVELRRGAGAVVLPAAAVDDRAQLIEAIRHYHPQATLHAFTAGTQTTPLTLTGSAHGDTQPRGPHPSPRDVAAMLTDEELAMLMGPISES